MTKNHMFFLSISHFYNFLPIKKAYRLVNKAYRDKLVL